MDGRVRHFPPEICRPGVKLPQLLRRALPGDALCSIRCALSGSALRILCFRIHLRCLVKGHVRIRDPDRRKLPRIQAAERRGQHGRQGQILPCIVQDPQIVQQHAHFVCLEIALPAYRVSRNAFFPEHGRTGLRPSADAPCQDHNIAVPDPPERFCLLVIHRTVPDQSVDPPGDHPCLRLRGVILPGILLIQKKKFTPVRILPLLRKRRELCARIKGRVIVILDPAQFPVHDLSENIIHTVQHFGAAAEIPVEVDPLPVTVLQAVCMVFLHKKFRPGHAETVNALLHVADHEHIILPAAYPRHTVQNRLLHQVAVLVLIDHYFVKLLLIFLRCRRRHQLSLFFLCEDGQGELLHIAEIDQVPGPFLLIQQRRELLYQSGQHGQGRGRVLHILLPHRARDIEIIRLQVIEQRLCLRAQFLHLFFFLRRDGLILFRRQPFPRKAGSRLIHPVKIPGLRKLLQLLQIRLQHIPVHVGAVRRFTHPEPPLQHPADIRGPCPDPFHGGLCKHRRITRRSAPVQPPVRPGIASGIFIHFQNDPLDLPVVPSCPEPLGKLQEILLP